jgi:hypothetical protein
MRSMKIYGIALVGLAFGVCPHYASASDTAEAVSSIDASTPSVAEVLPAKVQPGAITAFKRAELAGERASREVRHIADWAVDSGDNKGLPFLIIDKVNAKLFVFDAKGHIRGAAPVLLGLARGDHTVPGIGDRELSKIRPEERTTPAGRFVATRGMSTRGVDVVWVDYESGVSLHRVINGNRNDRRLERLATPTAADNRISYGCINVPVAFYNQVVNPSFTQSDAIVYVLPEVRPVREVFASYDVETRHQYAGRESANSAVVKTSSSPQ